MLEIKNLVKTYKSKKGDKTVALKSVSLKFPETGLIFILGKSGSGKSTLLNCMGGLDTIDEGEIIIKGRSSKDFKAKDFDAYRNTYLGFIFQDYNILPEFSVSQNVALALELQHKKATKKAINEILEEVDLKGYNNRKPNELSGGQKQRVAIARALVKNPQIIFADEPTGALDSKTGISVFDTLKKLSTNKLIVVVSHDREFAERYGDRVIELADGKIISDISKTKEIGQRQTAGISLIDGKVLKIEKGYKVTDNDMNILSSLLYRTNGNIIISKDKAVNDNVRHIARIDEMGYHDGFTQTDESKIEIKNDNFTKVDSKLSLKNSSKMGLSSLKTKPFRLILTLLLCIFSFSLFGIADTVSAYSPSDSLYNSIKDYDVNTIRIEKEKFIVDKENNNSGTSTINCNLDDATKIKELYNVDAKAVYKTNGFESISELNYLNDSLDNKADLLKKTYYEESRRYNGFISSNLDEITEKGFTINGRYPSKKDEIAITKNLYDAFKYFGYKTNKYYDQNDNVEILSKDVTEDKIISQKLYFDDFTAMPDGYTITGIIDTKFDQKFDALKNVTSANYNDSYETLLNEYQRKIDDSLAKYIFTCDKCIDSRFSKYNYFNSGDYSIDTLDNVLYYSSLSNYCEDQHYLLKSDLTTLSDNTILIPIDDLYQYVSINSTPFSNVSISSIKFLSLDSLNEKKVSSLYDLIDAIGNTEKRHKTFLYYFAKENYNEAIKNGLKIGKIFDEKYDQTYSMVDNSELNKKYDELTFYEKLYQYEDAHDEIKDYVEKYNDDGSRLSRAETLKSYEIALYSQYLYSCWNESKNNFTDSTNKKNFYIDDFDKKFNEFASLKSKNYLSLFDSILNMKIIDKICDLAPNIELKYKDPNINNQNGYEIKKSASLAVSGVDLTPTASRNNNIKLIISDNILLDANKNSSTDFIDCFICDVPNDALSLKKLCKDTFNKKKEDGYTFYAISDKDYYKNVVSSTSDMVNMFKIIFLIAAIVFAVIGSLLFLNYISISIVDKKKEIGILRALGAKSSDVFKIFYSEAFFMAIISFIVAIILTFISNIVLNNVFTMMMELKLTFFSSGIRQIALIFLVTILVSLVSAFFPTKSIAKKKPIDSIREK